MTDSTLRWDTSAKEWYSPFRIFQIICIGAFIFLSSLLAIEVAQGAAIFRGWWLLLPAVATGYVVADLVSGVVHFLADNFGTPQTPILGKAVIQPFRDHHTDPTGILHHSFVVANGNNCLISMLPVIAVLLIVPVDSSLPGALFGAFILSLCVATLLTNQIHKWAHMESPPAGVAWLQDRGLVLARDHHSIHHTSPFDTHYCITTGWWNPLLQRLGVFDRIVSIARGRRRA